MSAEQSQKKPGKDVATKPKLIELFSAQFHIEPAQMLQTLRNTCFSVKKGDPPATNEELAALVAVAHHYHLNPFLREIYAFRAKGGGIVPLVGVDGWVRIVESQPAYQGEEMAYGFDDTTGPDGKELGFYCEVRMHRSDRKFPIARRQYHKENVRNTDNWRDMPTRMLGHRAYIQSARAAFGLGGIYEPDEGEVIAIAAGVDLLPATPAQRENAKAGTEAPRAAAGAVSKANEDQLEHIRERLAKTGVPDNLVFAKYEVASLEDLTFDQAQAALQFIEDNSP